MRRAGKQLVPTQYWADEAAAVGHYNIAHTIVRARASAAEATRVGANPKKAFAQGVERLKPLLTKWKREHLFPAFRRLASDERMQCVWSACGGREEIIDLYLNNLFSCLMETDLVDTSRWVYDRALRERQEVERAVETIVKYYDRVTASAQMTPPQEYWYVDPPYRGDDLRPMLLRLVDFARHNADLIRDCIRPSLPASRKSRSDFLVRVYLSRVIVHSMKLRFGAPRYELVAATINALFNGEWVTADSVRDAGRGKKGGRVQIAGRETANAKGPHRAEQYVVLDIL